MPKKLELVPPPPAALTPLEYLLRVINDPAVDMERRVDAAIAALPYCHESLSPIHGDEDDE